MIRYFLGFTFVVVGLAVLWLQFSDIKPNSEIVVIDAYTSPQSK